VRFRFAVSHNARTLFDRNVRPDRALSFETLHTSPCARFRSVASLATLCTKVVSCFAVTDWPRGRPPLGQQLALQRNVLQKTLPSLQSKQCRVATYSTSVGFLASALRDRDPHRSVQHRSLQSGQLASRSEITLGVSTHGMLNRGSFQRTPCCAPA